MKSPRPSPLRDIRLQMFRGAKLERVLVAFSRIGRVCVAVLREIFDESAYTRFLACHQLTPSRASYAAFLSEHEHSKARRPRCC